MIFILPTYNQTKGLTKFLNLNKFNYKAIVSDNTKDNRIQEKIKKYKYIEYLKNHPNGPVENWNTGLKKIKTSDLVMMLHDDEYLNEELYEYISKLSINKDKVYLFNYAVKKNNKKVNHGFSPIVKSFLLKWLPESILFFNFIGPTAAYIYYYDKRNPEFYDINLTWLVDIEFFYRISRNKTYEFLPYTVETKLKKKSITQNLNNSKLKIFFKEITYIKNKFNISNMKFIFYILISFFIRAIKKTLNIFL